MTKTSRSGCGHLHAEAAGDLVAHAGIAVFEMVAARLVPPATACATRPAGRRRRRRRSSSGAAAALHGADHLGVATAGPRSSRGRAPSAASASQRALLAPAPCRSKPRARASRRARPTAARGRRGIGDQRQRAVLVRRRTACDVELRRGGARDCGTARRAGGEILQPRADGEDDVGLGRERVGGARAGDADRAEAQRMIVRQRRPCRPASPRPGCRAPRRRRRAPRVASA